ncbi:hypothetical protein [Sphingomonas aracearum]|uniref:Lipoprotein n=1 Tax=Sphingomonas aracearum TaxID=2283317 RepID=A0A369VS23_9SPHN|nr:hypothetical protein [Sphingomonas aracearum]RDE05186.1 hypothetical protein DVW87_07885 [Sphingomonas aracearum]
MRGAAAALLLLAACSREATPQATPATPGLEEAAVAAGIVADPRKASLTGLYARDTDRLCVVPQGDKWRVGVSVDFDERQGCSAAGTGTRSGERLTIVFPNCTVEAEFDGERLFFPATLPAGCARLCTDRATLTALEVEQLSASASEAATLRSRDGRLLCAS